MSSGTGHSWEELRAIGIVEVVPAGETVFHQGDPAEATYVVLSGRCVVLEGDEQVNELGPGELFGEIAALAGGVRTASVMAIEDTELLALSPRQLRDELSASPGLLWQSIRLLVERLGLITRRQIAYRDEHRGLREVQRSLLPDLAAVPAEAGIRVSGAWEPCTYASGDYYDVIGIGDGRWLVALGDVMGHGAQASLTMGIARAQVRHLARELATTGELLGSLDDYLRANAPPRHGMSMVVVVWDPTSGMIEYSAAGHPSPLLLRAGRVTPLDGRPGMLLALPLDRRDPYATHTTSMESGDRLLLFTDGLYEIDIDREGAQLGMEGLSEVFGSFSGSAGDLVARIADLDIAEVPDDDRTAVVIDFERFGAVA